MAANSFGKLFRITTFGESHGPLIGVVIDGCPAGLKLVEKDIMLELNKRQTNRTVFSSKRREKDKIQIVSGVFKNQTTGCPITILIENNDFSSNYKQVKDIYRPGHAHFTYLHKYGIFDYRGGGRASARETAARVAAGAIAKKLLLKHKIKLLAFINQIGKVQLTNFKFNNFSALEKKVLKSPFYSPDKNFEQKLIQELKTTKQKKETVGGVIRLISTSLPIGLGEPIFDKLSANLAKACFSIPAVKGFEIGEGFQAAQLYGSEMNDNLTLGSGRKLTFSTNRCGGMLGGISNGNILDLKVAFKPISTTGKKQLAYNTKKELKEFSLDTPKHDLCAALRAPVIVEAMAALVLIDALLINNAIQSALFKKF